MNDSEFSALADKLQGEVFKEAQEDLGPKGFERWRKPKFCGDMMDSDSSAKATGVCGDTMQMFLRVNRERIEDVTYQTDGCASSVIAGSFAAELAIGKSLEQIFEMSGSDVLREIGTFPGIDGHCAYLAVEVLQDAVNNYMVMQSKKD